MSTGLGLPAGRLAPRGGWSFFWQMYRGQFATALATQVAYRGATLIWVFTSIVHPLVSIVVWRSVAGGGRVAGYDASGFVTYFALEMVVNHVTFVWIMWEMEWRIRTGAYSPLLVRPVHPIHTDICQNLAYKLLGLVGILPAAVLLVLLFGGDLSVFTTGSVLAGLLATALAMVLRFMVEWTLSLAAFWVTKVSAINSVYFSLIAFLGGGFAPLAVLPGAAQTLAWWTPFPWGNIAWVNQVVTGRAVGVDLVRGYLAQLAWIAVALVVLKLVWARAVRTYSAVGS
ncbi:ABC transporter permease [Aestuariimicrobium kwangyangense]|uniref:ABC transporter permease n=1 Tax=Aestuariimicrobium kwangyangense TaxID=396389 RepID=UPI0003B52626|nr:ABC-2 family transporter protein [Aestuariimicrobium kwangyangense]